MQYAHFLKISSPHQYKLIYVYKDIRSRFLIQKKIRGFLFLFYHSYFIASGSFSYKNNNFTYTDRVGYVSANVTGANRLLAGLGWPLIMLINLYRNNKQINITKNNKLELVIIFAGLASMTLTFILDMQPLIMSAILICIYLFYLYVSSKKESEEPEFVGISKYITEFKKPV